MSINPLNDISRVYLEQIAEKKEEVEIDEASYSAKAARAGKDIGKPGKQFAKIAKSAAERYGSKERGEKVAGAVLAKLRKEALDPVGHEDKDIDNDGDHDKSDKYLLNRRKVRAAAISKKKMKESFSNWRQDLSEVMDDVEAKKEIKEKKVNNKVTINPDFKESVENMGGELIEMVEIEEGMTLADYKKKRSALKQKEKRAAAKTSSTRRAGIHNPESAPEREARRSAAGGETGYGGALRAKKVRKAKALGELGEEYFDEKTLTPSETKEKERLVKSMKKKAGDFEKRYPGRGKEVMYATATKMAKKMTEELGDETSLTPQELQKQRQKASLNTQIASLRKQALTKMPKPQVAKEEYMEEGSDEDAQERRFQTRGHRSRGETATSLIGKAAKSQSSLKQRQKKTKESHPKHQELGSRIERMSDRIKKLQKARQSDTSTFRQGPVGSPKPSN